MDYEKYVRHFFGDSKVSIVIYVLEISGFLFMFWKCLYENNDSCDFVRASNAVLWQIECQSNTAREKNWGIRLEHEGAPSFDV